MQCLENLIYPHFIDYRTQKINVKCETVYYCMKSSPLLNLMAGTATSKHEWGCKRVASLRSKHKSKFTNFAKTFSEQYYSKIAKVCRASCICNNLTNWYYFGSCNCFLLCAQLWSSLNPTASRMQHLFPKTPEAECLKRRLVATQL